MLSPTLEPVDSVTIFNIIFLFFRFLGINTGHNRYLCGFYDLFINIAVTIFYPLHLSVGLFLIPNLGDVFKNLAASITVIVSSFKHYILRYKLPKINTALQLLGELDQRATTQQERVFFKTDGLVGAKRIVQMFCVLYFGSHTAAIASTLISKEPRMMYPAWIPFDWQGSNVGYYVAITYQFAGATALIVENLANDIYPPLILCILSGHVHMLRLRLQELGTDPSKSIEEHEMELLACIHDYRKLMRVFALLQDTLSFSQLVQFLSTGLNICVILVYLLFYADNLSAYIYYSVYFAAMIMELFPSCYYGSILQWEFSQLPVGIFHSNWMPQSRKFKQNQRILTELTLRNITATAGGLIGIHLNAFFGTCKMAYSLYTVVIRTK